MDKRKEDLNNLKSYTNEIDNDLTMILQTLQWDRKHILEHADTTTCIYNANHRVLCTKLEEHQKECFLKHHGYSTNDKLLPDPVDTNVSTLIKLDKQAITMIIDNAAKSDPIFKRVHIDTRSDSVRLCPVYLLNVNTQVSLTQGEGCELLEPLSLGRLQCAYTPDERRAIHDAVVSAAPSCHDLTDLALPSANDSEETPKPKSRTEILAELRDMRRRRTKYRVAAKSRNYSDVLRDVIKTQMEHYNGVDVKTDLIQVDSKINKEIENDSTHLLNNNTSRNEDSREFSRRPDRDNDTGYKERERFYRDIRHGVENNDKRIQYERTDRRNEYYRERRHSRKGNKDDRYRERSRTVKSEVTSEDESHRDRSKDNYNEKHKTKERHESKHKKSARESQCTRSREYDDDRNVNRRDSSKYYKEHSAVSDRDRARNLITEVKREIDTVGRIENNDNRNKVTSPGSSIKIKQENTDHMSSRDGGHRYGDKDAAMSIQNRRHEYRCRERDQRKSSYIRIENDNRSDRSREVGRKRLRTEDKHKIYNEIYSEIYKKRNKLN